MYIPIILGTARAGRQSEKVSNYMLEEVKKAGHTTALIDVKDFLFGKTDRLMNSPDNKEINKYLEAIKEAKAIIIVSPEYNHSYPGELKILLDSLYNEYRGKFVGFCTVSNGPFGGVRVAQQLKLLSVSLQMFPINLSLSFGNIKDLFDPEGKILDQAYEKRVKGFLEELTNATSGELK